MQVTRSPLTVVIGHDSAANKDWVKIGDEMFSYAAPIMIYSAFPKYYEEYGASTRDVVVAAAPNARYGHVLTVIDAACSAGFSQFGFQNKIYTLEVNPDKTPTGFQKESTCGRRSDERELIVPLPRSSKKADAPSFTTRGIQVVVSAADKIWIDGRRTSAERLYEDMASAIRYHQSHATQGLTTRIYLIADANASWQTVIWILDAGRQAGDDDVGFVTQ